MSSFRGELTVYIKGLNGQTTALQVVGSDLISKVKAKIVDKLGIPQDQIRLLFASKQLDDDKTIAECGIKNESVVFLVTKLVSQLSRGESRVFSKDSAYTPSSTPSTTSDLVAGDEPSLIKELKELEATMCKEALSLCEKSIDPALAGEYDLEWTGYCTPTATLLTLSPDGTLYQTAGGYKGRWYTLGHILVLDYGDLLQSVTGGTSFNCELNSEKSCFRGLRTTGYSPYIKYVGSRKGSQPQSSIVSKVSQFLSPYF